MADLGVFSAKDFDPKSYINDACSRKPIDQPLDRYLAELEMKLHLGGEDIGLYLQDQSTRALQRIPVAARELVRIREDVHALRASVSSTLDKLQVSNSGSSISTILAELEELDAVKRRMEAACNTLKEATGLSTLFHLVEDLFAAKDLGRIAEALRDIGRGLAIVADSVPEFRDGRRRLEQLEQRFAKETEGPLTAALAGQRGEEAGALAAMLVDIHRPDVLSRAYVAARSGPLQNLWDGYTPATPFVSWVGTFYDQMLHVVSAEREWCVASLPEHHPDLLLGLLSTFFSSIDKPYRARLAGALTGTTASLLPLEHLEQAAASVVDFLNGLRQELAGMKAYIDKENEKKNEEMALLGLIAGPVENALAQYPERESQYLLAEMTHILASVRGAPGVTPEKLSQKLNSTVERAFGAAGAAIARCVRLSGGTGLQALVGVLDRALGQYIGGLHAAVSSVQNDGASGPSEAAIAPLLLFAANVRRQLEACVTLLLQTAEAELSALLDAPIPSDIAIGQPLSLAMLRLRAQPALRRQLEAHLARNTTPSLPSASAMLETFTEALDVMVEKVLLDRIIKQLATIPSLSEWHAAPPTSVALPSFTPYPLQYVTAVGEHLMMLPQLLESAFASELEGISQESEGTIQDDDKAAMVAEWVDRIAIASARQYQAEIAKIGSLSSVGSNQLGADIEYFANVLGTLGVAVPPELAAWQAALVAPDAAAIESLRSMAGAEGGSAEALRSLEVVARLRGFKLSAGN